MSIYLTMDSHGKPGATSRSVTPTQDKLASRKAHAPPSHSCVRRRTPIPTQSMRTCARVSIPNVRAGASASAPRHSPPPSPPPRRGDMRTPAPRTCEPTRRRVCSPAPPPTCLASAVPAGRHAHTAPRESGRQRRELRGVPGRCGALGLRQSP